MLDPAKPFSSRPRNHARAHSRDTIATAKADLTGLLDRARDERFRLLKMLKDARADVAVTLQSLPPAQAITTATDLPDATSTSDVKPPTTAASTEDAAPLVSIDPDRTAALVARLTELNEKLDEKLRRIGRLADDKLAQLESAEARIARLTQRFDAAQATAEQQMTDKVNAHQQRMAELTDAADRELQAHAQRLDDAVAGLTELFERQADHLVADLRDRATAALDQAKPNPDRLAA